MRWLAVATLAAALAGCGDDDEGLARTELAEQASAICTKYADQAEALGQPDLADQQNAEEYFSAAFELASEQQDELEALEPDGEVQADYEKLLAATEKATELLEQLAAAARAEDAARGVELTQQLSPLSVEVDAAAGAIGADDCAS